MVIIIIIVTCNWGDYYINIYLGLLYWVRLEMYYIIYIYNCLGLGIIRYIWYAFGWE